MAATVLVSTEAIARAKRLNEHFVIPKPLSRPLSFFYTYTDAERTFKRLVELYAELGTPAEELDWKRIRNTGGDEATTLVGILEQHIKKSQN
jgi:hypothetical protein